MAESIISTPIKVHFKEQCIACTLLFSSTEVTPSGRTIKTNLNTNKKLKCTKEIINDLKHVIGNELESYEIDFNVTYICVKCCRHVRSLVKKEEEILRSKHAIKESVLHYILINRQSTKRLLRSPASTQQMKKIFSPKVQIWLKTKLKSSSELKSGKILSTVELASCTAQSQLPSHTMPLICDDDVNQPELSAIQSVPFFKPILPSISELQNIPTVCAEMVQPEVKEVQGKLQSGKARKSLFSTEKPPEPIHKHTMVEMAIHYESGVKRTLIDNDHHIKMCKVIFYKENVEKGLLEILKCTNKEKVTACAADIVQNECQNVSKRQSNFPLNDKTYKGIMEFTWDSLHQNLLIAAPNTLQIISAMVTNTIQLPVASKGFHHVLFAIGIILHGRSRETTTLQYLNGMVLLHGGCTHRDIERLSKLGVCVLPETARRKLQSWQSNLDENLLSVKTKWGEGGSQTFQLIGDNWDKNIVPSYRTSQQTTQSIHLFNVIGVIDRVVVERSTHADVKLVDSMSPPDFIPSVADIEKLQEELTFIVARSIIENNQQMNELLGADYPDHFEHPYSNDAGKKTTQCSLGLFDCDEKKTTDVIKLLKQLSKEYVPQKDGEIIEEVFFGGDRLTDERIQVAQQAMSNADNGMERLEGFISKIEDFHRLMNLLEAIHKLTYNTGSSRDRGTMYYYRNLLNARNVKSKVKNAYRAYKHLYHTVFDALCVVLFLKHFNLEHADSTIPVPADFKNFTKDEKSIWMKNECKHIVKEIFGENLLQELRNILSDSNHDENYWVNSKENDKFRCHFCSSSYSYVASLKMHEKNRHGIEKTAKVVNRTSHNSDSDEVYNYLVALFRLTALHKNLDSAVDMGDGHRAVRSAKYETPIYHKTNKTKYLIGSVHLTALISGTLPPHQTERLIANRFINVSGGRNNNISLDEYVEILNRDTKNTTSGFQTKESIIKHSKEFPHLINAVKHVDDICNVRNRKGFHKLPSYKIDVQKVVADLLDIDGLNVHQGRKLHCRKLVQKSSNPYSDCFQGLSEMIVRHRPELPFRRLRNKHM